MERYLRNKKVRIMFAENIELQEVILDKIAQKKEEDFGVSEKRFEVPLSKSTIFSFCFIFLLLFFILFAKVFFFQVLEAKDISKLADNNALRVYLSQPIRGVVYDKDGKQLVFNEYSFNLTLDKRDLPLLDNEKDEVLKEVAGIINKDFNDFKKEVDYSLEEKILVFTNISHEKLLILEAKISQDKLPGLRIEQAIIRNYKYGKSFSHLIGYMGRINKAEYENSENYSITDYIGKLGVESFYEKILRGNPGIVKMQKDVLGNKKSEEIISEPIDGKSLVLCLDSDLQKKIEEELLKSLERIGGEKAAAVALDPRTGGVLALVSLPNFDNNIFSKSGNDNDINELLQNPLKPLFNRAISGKYLIGSTIKPLMSLAALGENIISPIKKIYSQGFIEVVHRYDPNIVYTFRDNAVHGWVDMKQAIAKSSNVYFYAIGGGYEDQEGLGPTRIKKYLELFGWNEKTGIDLPGEVAGLVPSPEWKKSVLKENWWDGDTYYLSIGQQYIQITPLEIVNSFAVIANGGILYEPMVVKEIIDTSDKTEENNSFPFQVVEKIEPKIIRENFIDPDNLKIVKEGMREAVISGTATVFNNLPIKSAAKTGTAELGNNRYNNWISVFAPYDDPEIVMTFIIEDVDTIYSTVSLAAKEVLNWYFSR